MITKEKCLKNEFQIVGMVNNLKEKEQDVLITIAKESIVCELRLAVLQEENYFRFVKNIEFLESSPIGCILGSIVMLCQGVQYPIHKVCKDGLDYFADK